MAVKPRPEGLDKPIVGKIMKWMSVVNVWVYRKTGGRLMSTWRVGAAFPWGVPICLLTTRGRKSGKLFTKPLLFIEDGERVVLVGSQGGLPDDPQWYLNLRAHPDVTVQIGSRVRAMRARTAGEAERAVLWPRLVAHYADFAAYQSWTERVIPVVICEPEAQAQPAAPGSAKAGPRLRSL
jgi:deazaflavin-dependent oxidoreductase (nitroreductase family)